MAFSEIRSGRRHQYGTFHTADGHREKDRDGGDASRPYPIADKGEL